MKITIRRVVTAVMLTGAAITIYQLMSKPQSVAVPQSVEMAQANAQSFDQKMAQLEASRTPDGATAEARFTSEEVSAELAQAMGAVPASVTRRASSAPSSPDSVVGTGQVQVKGYQVELVGDVARGQFVTQVAGQDLYVTLAGHLGSQEGYVTFDPTEFKVGDFSIPVSLVNSALQKKLSEQREQLKLPEGLASLRVENSELVLVGR
jgi:hypothetical protein